MPPCSPICRSRTRTRSSDLLLQHREATKLRQIIESLDTSIAADGRIRTTYVQTGSQTGRLSSTDPNLQNIPVRTEESRRIRSAFEVGAGYETLLTADYSQIEMRIMAHLSEDPGLIEAFNSGEDLHRFVGARVFGVEPEDVTLRDAHQGQGDVVRTRLRSRRRSACPSSCASSRPRRSSS